MSDNINNTNPPSEPLTREEEYLSAIAGVTSSDDIPEKPLTRVEKYLNKIVEDGGGSVYDKLEAGTNINIEETSDGKAKISASGEVSSEDTYARAEISAILDGASIDSFADVEAALADKVDKVSGKGLSANDFTNELKSKLDGIAAGAEVNVQADWNQTTDTADDYIKNKPTLGTAAAKNATDTYSATGDDVTTGKAVAAALATLPEPMIFKGSLGTGGTITTLPTASSSNKGYVYKVITAGTYASQTAKVGDTFISDGSAWVLIPSGDEPSGTVTNVAVANGGGLTVSGSPVTSSGTITVGHSNSVTAKTSSSVKKFTYDAYGHVTGSSELSTAESNALASGIDSTKVEQIETNKNNILKITPVTLSKRHKPQSADYEIISDLTISIPAGKKYLIHATAMFNNVAPKGVIINKTNAIATNKNTVFSEIDGGETDYGGLTASAIMSNTGSSAFDICIFAKYKSANASGSDVIVSYQDITENS